MGIACDAVGLEAIEQKTIQLMKENLSLSLSLRIFFIVFTWVIMVIFIFWAQKEAQVQMAHFCYVDQFFFTPNHWMYSSISTSFGLGQRPYFGLPYRPRVWWVIMHGLIHVQSVYWFPVFICLRCFCFFCWVFLARSKIKIK